MSPSIKDALGWLRAFKSPCILMLVGSIATPIIKLPANFVAVLLSLVPLCLFSENQLLNALTFFYYYFYLRRKRNK